MRKNKKMTENELSHKFEKRWNYVIGRKHQTADRFQVQALFDMRTPVAVNEVIVNGSLPIFIQVGVPRVQMTKQDIKGLIADSVFRSALIKCKA